MNSNSVDWPLLAGALLPWAAIAVAALITPRLTRPDLFFAVTVRPSFRLSREGSEILRQYYWLVLAAALLALLPLGCFKFSGLLVLFGLLGPVAVELVGWFGAFLVARRRTMPHHVESTTRREAVLVPRRISLPGGWIAQVGPFLILLGIALCLWLNWNRIPERIPIHWGAGGEPNGWAMKSTPSVFGGTAFGVLMCLLLGGINYAIVHGVRRIHSSGRAALGEARFLRAISLFLLGLEYWLALLMGLFSLAALRQNPSAPLPAFWPILLGQTLIIGAVFLISFRTGQGGWRLGTLTDIEEPGTDVAPVGDRTPDECWKLGMFYFNRGDPAVFVEKRFGVGWTLNFGNWKSWLVIGALLFFLAAALSLSLVMSLKGHG